MENTNTGAVHGNHIQLLQIVLNNSASIGKGAYYRFFKMVVGEGLFTAPGE